MFNSILGYKIEGLGIHLPGRCKLRDIETDKVLPYQFSIYWLTTAPYKPIDYDDEVVI